MHTAASQTGYRVYKRRFWGLAQLVLLNIVVSWDVCIFTFFFCCYDAFLLTMLPQVAHLLCHLDHHRGVFPGLRKRRQLDEHRVPICFLSCQPVSLLNGICERL